MGIVGRGAREIRVHVDGQLRVFYVATFAEAVYVLHVFQKKSKRGIATPEAVEVFDEERHQALLNPAGFTSRVRRHDHARIRVGRLREIGRFGVVYVERRSGEAIRGKRCRQQSH